jgi:hypothetical protein
LEIFPERDLEQEDCDSIQTFVNNCPFDCGFWDIYINIDQLQNDGTEYSELIKIIGKKHNAYLSLDFWFIDSKAFSRLMKIVEDSFIDFDEDFLTINIETYLDIFDELNETLVEKIKPVVHRFCINTPVPEHLKILYLLKNNTRLYELVIVFQEFSSIIEPDDDTTFVYRSIRAAKQVSMSHEFASASGLVQFCIEERIDPAGKDSKYIKRVLEAVDTIATGVLQKHKSLLVLELGVNNIFNLSKKFIDAVDKHPTLQEIVFSNQKPSNL